MISEVSIAQIPPYVVVIHRLVRLGKATFYSPSKRFIQVDFKTHEGARKLQDTWVNLADVDTFTIIYRERKV